MVDAVSKIGDESILQPMPSQVIKARQDIKKALSKTTAKRPSLFDHVVKIMDTIVMSCPDQAIERVEEISYLIKNSDEVALEDFVRMHDTRAYACHNDDVAAGTTAPIEQLRAMFSTSAAAVQGGDDGEEASGPVLGLVQDICGLNKHVFNMAGVEIGEYGSLILQKSI